MHTRRAEADAYYNELQKDLQDPDARLVQRQALAGMIWSKQYFYYDVPEWLQWRSATAASSQPAFTWTQFRMAAPQ